MSILKTNKETLKRDKLPKEVIDQLKKMRSKPSGLFFVAGSVAEDKSEILKHLSEQIAKKGEKVHLITNKKVDRFNGDVEQVVINPKIGYGVRQALYSLMRNRVKTIFVSAEITHESLELAARSAIIGTNLVILVNARDGYVGFERLYKSVSASHTLINFFKGIITCKKEKVVQVILPNKEFATLINKKIDKRSVFEQLKHSEISIN